MNIGEECDETVRTNHFYSHTNKLIKLLKSRYQTVRSAHYTEESGFSENENSVDQVIEKLNDVSQQIIIIQEAIKHSKLSEKAVRAVNTLDENTDDARQISELLKSYFSRQEVLMQLSEDLKKARIEKLDSQKTLASYVENHRKALDEDSKNIENQMETMHENMKEKITKEIKDIRFLQLCIPSLVQVGKANLNENNLKEIIRAHRDPIVSVDHFL